MCPRCRFLERGPTAWGPEDIFLVHQTTVAEPMLVSQALHLYRNSVFIPLETFTYDIFPIGAFGRR